MAVTVYKKIIRYTGRCSNKTILVVYNDESKVVKEYGVKIYQERGYAGRLVLSNIFKDIFWVLLKQIFLQKFVQIEQNVIGLKKNIFQKNK